MSILDIILPSRRAEARLNRKYFHIKERQRYHAAIRDSALELARDTKTIKQDEEHRKGAPVCKGCDHFHFSAYDYKASCVVTPIGPVDWKNGNRDRATISNARSGIAPCGPTGKLYTPFVEPDISKEMEQYDADHPME